MSKKRIATYGCGGCLIFLLVVGLSIPVAGVLIQQINRVSAGGPVGVGPVELKFEPAAPLPTTVPNWSGATAAAPTASPAATPRPRVGVYETGPGFLHGIVRDCSGEPVVGGRVCIAATTNHCARTLANGEFRIDISLLESGTYSLVATGFADGEIVKQTADLRPDAAPQVNFVGVNCLP